MRLNEAQKLLVSRDHDAKRPLGYVMVERLAQRQVGCLCSGTSLRLKDYHDLSGLDAQAVLFQPYALLAASPYRRAASVLGAAAPHPIGAAFSHVKPSTASLHHCYWWAGSVRTRRASATPRLYESPFAV